MGRPKKEHSKNVRFVTPGVNGNASVGVAQGLVEEYMSKEDFSQKDIRQEDTKQELEEKNLKRKTKKRIILSVLLGIVTFLGGMTTGWFLLEPEFRSLIKTKIAIDRLYYKDIEDSEFFTPIFDAVNEQVLDAYSRYMTADEYRQYNSEGEGNRSGIGIVFLTQDSTGAQQLRVTRVCGNSPAEAAGIHAEDYVLGFGVRETEITESEEFAQLSAFLAERKDNETFYLKVRDGKDADAPIRIVPISKQNYVENYVFYRTATTAYRFEGEDALTMTQKGEPLTCLDAKTAYIRLTEFNGNAAEEFKKVMGQFRADGMKNLVLDLRGNGGGFLYIMQEIASYFAKNATERKPLAVVADYGEFQQSFKAKGNYYYDYFQEDSRICVLADSDTASASECLIGFMVDYGAVSYADICLTERYGVAKTYGKGIMQSTYSLLLGGDAIKLTTAVIYWPKSNHCIHGRGILPEDGALSVAEMDDFDAEILASVQKLFE